LGERHWRHHLLVHEGDECVVDLEVEPGIDDRAVLGAQRLGEREQEALLVAIMLVAGVRECAGRCHHGKESGHVLRSRQPGLEIGDVAMQLCMPSIDEG